MTSSTASRDGENRLVGRVENARELLHLPGCGWISGDEGVVGGDGSTLTFYCPHSHHRCPFKVALMQDGSHYAVYTSGEHSHGVTAGPAQAMAMEGDEGKGEPLIHLYVKGSHSGHVRRPISTRRGAPTRAPLDTAGMEKPSARKQKTPTTGQSEAVTDVPGYQLLKTVDSRPALAALQRELGLNVSRRKCEGSNKCWYRCRQKGCPLQVMVEVSSEGTALKGGVRDVRRERFSVYGQGEHSHPTGQRGKKGRGGR